MLAGQRGEGRISWKSFWQCARSARIWQSLPGRADRRPQHLPADRDSLGVGLCQPWSCQPGYIQHRGQNPTLGWALLPVFLILLLACGGKKESPQETFERIRLTFLQGDLSRARTEADRAYKRFSGHDALWSWKFRLLEAEILANQGLSQDVLSSLNSDLPQSLANGDLDVCKHMLEALAYSHLGRFPEADQNLQQAERLCTLSHCVVMGEVEG